mmetsp:Transcript_93099/g.146292  ORF Transcript_93099/g.146292 Transcript_93099/m.146292 type:complete len:311 (+) Transcript_93099:55-987(+)
MHAVVVVLIGFAWADSSRRIHKRIEHAHGDVVGKFAKFLLALGNPRIRRDVLEHKAQPATFTGEVVRLPRILSTRALSKRRSAPRASAEEKQNLIQVTDELHAKSDVDAYFDMLQAADESDSDIAWRMARAYHDKAMEISDKDERERLLRKGVGIAENACESFGDGYSLKWYGILLGRLGDFLSTNDKVKNSFKIKETLDASAAKLPEDSTVKTALGQWCFKVASISFVERQAAKLLFGGPPTSSYEEALEYLLASHKLRPSKKAALYAGLCYQKLKKKDEAKTWFQACLDLPSSGQDDAELDAQAKKNI